MSHRTSVPPTLEHKDSQYLADSPNLQPRCTGCLVTSTPYYKGHTRYHTAVAAAAKYQLCQAQVQQVAMYQLLTLAAADPKQLLMACSLTEYLQHTATAQLASLTFWQL